MSKKKKATVKSTNGKKVENSSNEAVKIPAAETPKEKPRMCIRAIRITPEILEAAKSYKKDKGISFYRLGMEAISERLVREGYLKESGNV